MSFATFNANFIRGGVLEILKAYPQDMTVEQQLGNLFDDIEAGVFGDIQGKSKFYTAIKNIKEAYPKD